MREIDFYQAPLSLPHLVVERVELSPKCITLCCHVTTPKQPCPHCLRPTAQVNQFTLRQVRDLDISARQVWLSVGIRQFFCPDCYRHFAERLAFADPGKSHTHQQAKWIFNCWAKQPFIQVSALLDMNAKTVERIYYRQVQARLDLPARYAAVRRLRIDEISHLKDKASYRRLLVDLDKNITLDVLPSRTKKFLIAHFQKFGSKFFAQIESVKFDMWYAHCIIIKRFFPQDISIVDRFLMVKAMNKTLAVFRHKLRREQPEAFRNIDLDLPKVRPTPAQQTRLQATFAHSLPLGELVALRDDFYLRFASTDNPDELEQALVEWWIAKAKTIRQCGVIDFLHTLSNWLRPIANFNHYGLTNAATEGHDNVIRYVMHISYGLPPFEHFRLRVIAQAS